MLSTGSKPARAIGAEELAQVMGKITVRLSCLTRCCTDQNQEKRTHTETEIEQTRTELRKELNLVHDPKAGA